MALEDNFPSQPKSKPVGPSCGILSARGSRALGAKVAVQTFPDRFSWAEPFGSVDVRVLHVELLSE
jgi:hypothetical protein